MGIRGENRTREIKVGINVATVIRVVGMENITR